MPAVSMKADRRPDTYPYTAALQGQDYTASSTLPITPCSYPVGGSGGTTGRGGDTGREQPHIFSIAFEPS